jgi:hypothetical protein
MGQEQPYQHERELEVDRPLQLMGQEQPYQHERELEVDRPLQLMGQEQPYQHERELEMDWLLQLMGQEQPYSRDERKDGDHQEWTPDDMGNVDSQWGQDSRTEQKRDGIGSSRNGQGCGQGKRVQTGDWQWGQDLQRDHHK